MMWTDTTIFSFFETYLSNASCEANCGDKHLCGYYLGSETWSFLVIADTHNSLKKCSEFSFLNTVHFDHTIP